MKDKKRSNKKKTYNPKLNKFTKRFTTFQIFMSFVVKPTDKYLKYICSWSES